MATAAEPMDAGAAGRVGPSGLSRGAALALTAASMALALWGAVLSSSGGALAGDLFQAGLVVAWALAGATLALRRPGERLGLLVLLGSAVAGAGTLAAAVLRDQPGDDVAALVRALAVALLPAVGLHLLLGLPHGHLATRANRIAVAFGYILGAGLGVVLWAQRPSLPLWPVVAEAALALAVGLTGASAQYRRARGLERRRMQWAGWGLVVAAEIALVALVVRAFAGWPSHEGWIAAAATLPVLLALAIGSSRQLGRSIDRLLVHTISLVGLSVVVVGVYLVIVLGLGRVPTEGERTLLLVSMLAAGVAALLYLPARERLSRLASRLVDVERQAPDEILRTFGSRLSRAVPLDELLLELAESLRETLALAAAEVWTGSGGTIERAVSDPRRSRAQLVLAAAEESVVAHTTAAGPAWLKVWLPQLLEGREEAVLRVAPIAQSGELFGLIVAERPPGGEAFTEADDRILAELARQVGLALRNVRLDSALQASIDEVRRQAEELRASRARVVAAADEQRRQIERDLHDGAQQHLVALAVNLRLARELAESDPDQAKALLEDVGAAVEDALQEVRDLAHGIYPPLLLDRGLSEALTATASRGPVRAIVEADGIGRCSPEVEATVYFCCLEALQNIGKHAGEGARPRVRIWEEEGGLLFEVADDGVGFDLERRARGSGLTNMSDRLGAIGGSFRIESVPGRGTRVTGAIPLLS